MSIMLSCLIVGLLSYMKRDLICITCSHKRILNNAIREAQVFKIQQLIMDITDIEVYKAAKLRRSIG